METSSQEKTNDQICGVNLTSKVRSQQDDVKSNSRSVVTNGTTRLSNGGQSTLDAVKGSDELKSINSVQNMVPSSSSGSKCDSENTKDALVDDSPTSHRRKL